MNQTALITGASSGIGSALAHEFARHKYNIAAVAEDASSLNATARELRALYPIDVIEIHENLINENAPQRVYDKLKGQAIQIDVLVNNAGVGQKEKFHESNIEKDIYIVRLNVEAMMRLTKLFLRDMVNRGDGKVLNLSSVAGFQPGPLLAVYHASKAFVVSFSEAIMDELKDTGVNVTVLCPGPTDTNFFDRADMENARILKEGIIMEPGEVARIGFDALMENERIVIPGLSNKLLTFSRRFMPKSAQAALNKKFYEVKEEGTL